MALLLSGISFVSGAAGVLFETLWFRVTGITLGNSVWTSNIVLASFMAGLAAGNAIATEGPRKVQAQLLRTLALGLLGRERDARDCLDSIAVDGLSPVDAYSIKWLARFLQRGERRADSADSHKPATPIEHKADPSGGHGGRPSR